MIDYGAGPAADEIEAIVFGPGYGEAIAVHLGGQTWMLVDSCLDPTTKTPASLVYLDRIGVPHDAVKSIVASHWHDDHVRGLSALLVACPQAELNIATVFRDKEAMAFLAAFSGQAAPGLTRGASELARAIDSRDQIYFVHQRCNIFEQAMAGCRIRVTAMSPVEGAIANSVARLASFLPARGGGSPINHAPELRPNLESVVVHVDLDGDAILLGSDLENHDQYGWSAVVADSWCTTRPLASAYKVAHHGSCTGDMPHIWTALLKSTPVACVTPFALGGLKLPTEHDKTRIRASTPHCYISSGATRRPEMDSMQLKRLGVVCRNLTRVNSGFGAVRLRKVLGQDQWSVECFGAAQEL